MTNCHPTTGIRYGVIAAQNLDGDLLHELFYGPQAVDLSYEAAYKEAKAQAESDWANHLELANIAATETDTHMGENERCTFLEDWLAAHGGHTDQESFVDDALEEFSDRCQIEEPSYEGEYEGVKYGLSTLGGAYLLWVYEGPEGNASRLCSPCVPNAADLDGGFVLDTEVAPPSIECEEVGISSGDHDNGFPCYCVPRDWLAKESS